MSHTVNGVTMSYTWDVVAKLPLVPRDGDNTYVYGLDLISSMDKDGVQTYFLYDGLGSTTDVTDGNGNVVDDYTYDIFGAIRSQGGSSDNYWLFTEEQLDAESGLYYLRARYYDPEIGRFLGRDPLRGTTRNPQSLNRYAYVQNNLVNFVDPAGLAIIPLPLFGEKKEECDGDEPIGDGETRAGGRAESIKTCLWDCFCPGKGLFPDWVRGIGCGAIWGACGTMCVACALYVGPACAGCAACLGFVGGNFACVYECRQE